MSEEFEKSKVMLTQAVLMFSTTALQGLGQVPHPVTNKAEKNLEAAQMGIDMLDMLLEKTRGNVDEDETRMLTETLSQLKMLYVQTLQSDKPSTSGEESLSAPAEDTAAAEEASPGIDTPKNPPDDKEPRFHKSYG